MNSNTSSAIYKYFLLGDSVPVKVTFNDQGNKINAEVPNRETGTLKSNVTYLSRLERSFEVEEITAEEFQEKCELTFSQ